MFSYDEHFTVDGTLIEAWASQKSFQKKDGGDNEPGQFRAQKRSNDTHESKTDPDARLYRKGNGQEAKLGYLGHVLMENRHGLIVDAMLTHADGRALFAEDEGTRPAAARIWRGLPSLFHPLAIKCDPNNLRFEMYRPAYSRHTLPLVKNRFRLASPDLPV